MKKFILIAVSMLFFSARGYCQLMQSNDISASASTVKDTISHLKKVENRTDSLGMIQTFQVDPDLVKLLNYSKQLTTEYSAQEERIRKLKQIENRNKAQQRDIDYLVRLNAQRLKSIDTLKQKIEANINDTQILHDQVNKLLIEKYTNLFKVLDKDIETYTAEISKNDQNALTRFDTLIHISKGNIANHTSLFKEIIVKNVEIKRNLDALKAERDAFHKSYLALSRIQEDIIRYTSIKESIYSNMVRTQQEVIDAQLKLQEGIKKFVDNYNAYVDSYNNYAQKINDERKKMEQEEKSTAKQASALAGINKIFGDHGSVMPVISLIGQKKFSSDADGSIYGEVRLFTGGNTDDKTNNGTNNLFVPEASTFGFMTDFSFGFISASRSARKSSITGRWEQKLGINIGVYYLGKKIQPDTLTRFTANVFHVKAGLQYIVIPHVLSAYINTNCLLVGTNVNKVEKYYTGVSKLRSFMSFGIESYLDIDEASGFHLLINLGFVSINEDVRAWTKNNDGVIPSAKVSLVKTFGW